MSSFHHPNSGCSSDGLAPLMQKAGQEYADTIPLTATDTPCCSNPPSNPPLCPEREAWRFKFKGCQSTFSTPASGQCQVAPRGARFSVADLNPLLYERALVSGAKWNPYKHMNARQGFVQFLMADMRRDGDPYTRPVKNIGDTYCNRQKRQGPPAYTSF